MRIESKTFSIVMKVLIGGLSLVTFWIASVLFGAAVWRLFFAWVLLLAGIYYLVTAAVLAFSDRPYDYAPCPMLVGLFVINFLLISLTSFAFAAAHRDIILLSGIPAALLYGTLPALALADWFLFVRKGYWHTIYPFYWLALPTIYAAFIVLTATLSPDTSLAYPLGFLDWQSFGFSDFCTFLSIFAILILVGGYLFVLLDGLISGKISQYIVLPHIKTIDDEPTSDPENPNDVSDAKSDS